MAFEKTLTPRDIQIIAARTGFRQELIVKDYYITALLFLCKDVQGVHFKGGTALNKIVIEYARISEDIDYTLAHPIIRVRDEMNRLIDASRIFGKTSADKHVDGFLRLVVPYETPLGAGRIFIDLNKRGRLITTPELRRITPVYSNIPPFSISCLSEKEMIAEKVAAAICRNKPRDHYDIYRIIKKGLTIDLDLVAKKCEASGDVYDVVRMFSRAKKLKRRWDEDLQPLIVADVTFDEVMTTLAAHFRLKEEKERRRRQTG